MNKEEIERYRIRNYYMMPIEIVDNIFYSFEQEKNQLQERIDKAIDKLYCWGEALDPEFQKGMLDILKGGNNE